MVKQNIATVAGSFAAPGQSAAVALYAKANVTISGTFTGTIKIERSFDEGATWQVLSRDSAGAEAAYTAPMSLTLDEPESGMLYRLNATALSAGTAVYRISR